MQTELCMHGKDITWTRSGEGDTCVISLGTLDLPDVLTVKGHKTVRCYRRDEGRAFTLAGYGTEPVLVMVYRWNDQTIKVSGPGFEESWEDDCDLYDEE